jgi:putative tricarboxylic transport membrane protein
MYIDLIFPSFFGTVLGTISGIIPGVGNFAAVLLAMPYLMTLDPIQIISFYVCLTTLSQYVGSVPAIAMGIPGESSSLPAVIESKKLKSMHDVKQSIICSAVGSTFGGLIVLAICYIMLEKIIWSLSFFNTYAQFILYTLVLFATAFLFRTNKFHVNLLLIFFGLFLGSIGYNKWVNQEILTFGNKDLYGGIPLVVISIALFGIPEIIKNYNSRLRYKKDNARKKVHIKFNFLDGAFYSAIGFVGGLAPGLTTTMSSQLAYLVSKLRTQDPVKRIVASETANNAGAFSQLLPMLMLGIPLIGSEALVVNLVESKGFNLGYNNFEEIFLTVCFVLVLVNPIGLLIAWPGASLVLSILKCNLQLLYCIIIFILIVSCLYTGYMNYQLFYYSWIMIVMIAIGLMMRKMDTMPLVFAFLIHDKILDVYMRTNSLFSS